MPGPILHLDATVLCMHGGQAFPTASSSRVFVSGMPITTITISYTVTGCPLESPCVTAQWVVGAERVTSEGQPVVIMTGMATCVPTGTPQGPVNAQTRAIAT